MAKVKKESKVQKEVYSEEDLISRGTYISTMDKFFDHLYLTYPELVNTSVIIGTTYKQITELEKKNLFERAANSGNKYIFFSIRNFKEEGFVKADPSMFNDEELKSMFGENTFGIIELIYKSKDITYLELYYHKYTEETCNA
jgi:hypothetical protein